jgi:hypothetical protein
MSQDIKSRWKLDYEVEEATDGRLTAARLRKDRRQKQLIPFHRLGRTVYYDLAEIDAAIEACRFGGNLKKKRAA